MALDRAVAFPHNHRTASADLCTRRFSALHPGLNFHSYFYFWSWLLSQGHLTLARQCFWTGNPGKACTLSKP
eukprot:858901-Amphidinium_carterae.1